jgi:hypothetical protein
MIQMIIYNNKIIIISVQIKINQVIYLEITNKNKLIITKKRK